MDTDLSSLLAPSELHDFHILFIADIATAHRLEVRGVKLTVDEDTATRLHELSQRNERELAGTGPQREHTFADKNTAHTDSIEPPDELLTADAIFRHLDTAGKTMFVQSGESFYHVFSQPCTFLVKAQLAAIVYDTLKILIDADAIALLIYKRSHGVRNVYFVWKDNKTLMRTIPHDFIGVAKAVPRKYSIAVGHQQTVYTQVTTDGQQSVIVGQTRVGEPNIIV